MGLIFSLIKCFIKLLLYLAIFVMIIVLIPNLPPYTKFTSISLEPTLDRTGPLAPNGVLNNVQKMYEGKLSGPEAFQIYNGELYTSLETGEIVKISPGGHVTFVTKIGQPCSGLTQEHICGRPLDFEIDEKMNKLFVADAYYGIWKVDLNTDKKQLLVSPRVPIEGREPKLFNSLALAQNGDLYWTDSTSDFQLRDGVLGVLADPSGRMFHYNAAKNQSKVLLDNLWFPNGIVLSNDKQFVLIVETSGFRLIKYYIDGPKKGKSEIFAAGLPGTPDNIRVLPDNSGVLVGLYTAFDDEHPLITRTLSETPLVRKFVARLLRLIEIPFENLNTMYPHIIFEEIVYKVGNFRTASGLVAQLSGLLHLDWNGNIVASYFNTDGSVRHISDAIVYNGKLYTGSPHNQDFIGAVSAPPALLKSFTVKRVEEPKMQAVPKPEEKRDIPKVIKPVTSQSSTPAPVTTPKPKNQTPSEKKSATENKSVPPNIKPLQKNKETETKSKPGAAKLETKTTPTETVKTAQTTAKPSTKHTTPEMKPTIKPVTEPIPKSRTEPITNPDSKPVLNSEIKSTSKSETKQSSKQDDKPTLKHEAKLSQKQEMKPTFQKEPKPTPEAEVKTTKSPKGAESKLTSSQKEIKNKIDTKKDDKVDMTKHGKTVPKEIPIKENIPSDTEKPNNDKLKVIKKSGPTEIPNPEK